MRRSQRERRQECIQFVEHRRNEPSAQLAAGRCVPMVIPHVRARPATGDTTLSHSSGAGPYTAFSFVLGTDGTSVARSALGGWRLCLSVFASWPPFCLQWPPSRCFTL